MLAGLRAIAVRERLGQLGPQKENLARVVNPDHQNDNRCGGSVGGGEASLAQIEAKYQLADSKQQRSGCASKYHVTPFDTHIRHDFVDRSEEAGDYDE